MTATKLYNTDSQLTELFNEYIENEQYQEIITSQIRFCCKTYPARLHPSDWKQIGDVALWKSIRKYTTEGGTKFTTYLYGQVKYEYMNYIKEMGYIKASSYSDRENSEEMGFYDSRYDSVEVKELIESLPKRMRDIIVMRFYDRRTLAYIGELYNITTERVRQIEANALEIMQENAIRVNNRPRKRRVA